MTRQKFNKRDEPALVRAMHRGSLWAYQELVLRYTPRALKRAHHYARKWHLRDHFEDLLSEFMLCICVHIRNFDLKRGSSIPDFLEYHFLVTTQKVYGRVKFPVTVPVDGAKLVVKTRKICKRLREQGLPDDDVSVAAQTRNSAEQVGVIRRIAANPVLRLDNPAGLVEGEEGEFILRDVFMYDDPNTLDQLDVVDQKMRRRKLSEALPALNSTERRIIQDRHLKDDSDDVMTLCELGAMLRLSRERVRQLEIRALSKLVEEVRGAMTRKRENA